MTSASHHLATCCSSTVLPVPKPPGTAAVLPRATGNSTSSTRCPVNSGSRPSSRSAYGRGRRTGQIVVIGTSTPPTDATTSSGAHGPSGRSSVTSPDTSGGTRTRCSSEPVGTVPSTAPGPTVSPADTDGVKVTGAVGTVSRPDPGQRAEQTVVDPAEQPRPEPRGQRVQEGGHRVARPEPAGVVVRLHADD